MLQHLTFAYIIAAELTMRTMETLKMAETVKTIPVLQVTQAALNQLKVLIEGKRKEMPLLFFRIFAAQGCAGIQYGFSFVGEKTPADNDVTLVDVTTEKPINDIPMLTDEQSALLINGATIDFAQDDKVGPRFIVNNPNDTGAGCAGCAGSCSS